ncbi:hypothetical protein DFP72DRAFT_909329 [Ephemerocybe angulata]|uniref:Tet-like 2OG-Fe(II) oxygenase domain-containing protein n=1 Tax=Ephemerocybe angulata TaxID=980116 RepID=A0A8H6HQD0_9AGAR|nr:hypothetical protein DFP72DRAFT_909329 [Tulosesus angulatus]
MEEEDARAELEQRAREEREAEEAKREKELRDDKIREHMLRIFTGMEDVKIHRVQRNASLLKELEEQEQMRKRPLKYAELPDSLKAQFIGIREPGLHVGLEGDDIVFAVRIRPWGSFSDKKRDRIQDKLAIIMDYSRCSLPIKNNGSQNASSHGIRNGKDAFKAFGSMFAIGWHASMELGKTVVSYATAKSLVAQERLEGLLPRLPEVAQLYREGFCSLFPGAYERMSEEANSRDIAEWSDILFDGTDPKHPFANALVATNNDFCNFLHVDKDEIELAYGMWWAGILDPNTDSWRFDENIDHSNISGGQFIWGEYGIMVDFERSAGLVDIFWRGKKDQHSTMQSSTPKGMARFGTSVQITARGAGAFRRFWEMDESKRRSALTTMHDRLAS